MDNNLLLLFKEGKKAVHLCTYRHYCWLIFYYVKPWCVLKLRKNAINNNLCPEIVSDFHLPFVNERFEQM